jgi:hypothetical protein
VAVDVINKATLLHAALFEDRPVDRGFVTVQAFGRAVALGDVKLRLCDR